MTSRTRRSSPPTLNKRYLATFSGFDCYAVNAYAIRSLARPDEEFTNFATNDEFPDLIPPGQIWLADQTMDEEGLFFLVNAVYHRRQVEKDVPEDTAYTAALNLERELRERFSGLTYRGGQPHQRVPERVYFRPYTTLADPRGPIEVWLVHGSIVRSLYKTDYTEGGHGYVYRWVPKKEIWIEKDLDRREMPFIVCHEYLELRLMREEGLEYDVAHEMCSKVEFQLRKGKGLTPHLVSGHRKVRKPDLQRLPHEDVFRYVVGHYVRK